MRLGRPKGDITMNRFVRLFIAGSVLMFGVSNSQATPFFGSRPAIPPYFVTKAAVTLRPQRNRAIRRAVGQVRRTCVDAPLNASTIFE